MTTIQRDLGHALPAILSLLLTVITEKPRPGLNRCPSRFLFILPSRHGDGLLEVVPHYGGYLFTEGRQGTAEAQEERNDMTTPQHRMAQPLSTLEACKGCIHDCKTSSLNGAALVCCPKYRAVKRRRTSQAADKAPHGAAWASQARLERELQGR